MLFETLQGSAQRYLGTHIAPRLFHQPLPESYVAHTGLLPSTIGKLGAKYRTRDALSEIGDDLKSLTLAKSQAEHYLPVIDTIDRLKRDIELLSVSGQI